MRVGLIEVANTDVKIIGDVHLGRRFLHGVPLHRRGEREKMVQDQFSTELTHPGDAKIVVQVGDIFDKFLVPLDVIMFAAQAIQGASEMNPDTQFFFIRGNHDASRDLEKWSAFDVLHELCVGLDNVTFVVDTPLVESNLVFFPWHPLYTSKAMVDRLVDGIYGGSTLGVHFDAAFGHWDLESYGDDNPNLIPIRALHGLTKLVITGHDHKPRRFGAVLSDTARDGWAQVSLGQGDMDVIVTGSMAPYAHGEEETPDMYLTFTLDEFEEWIQSHDPKHKCIRLLLQPGEVLPDFDDCLQLTAKRVSADGEDEPSDVELGEFNLEVLFKAAFEEAEVGDEVSEIFINKFKELKVS